MSEKPSYDKTDFQRDIVEKSLERANNGKWYYDLDEIINILEQIYPIGTYRWPLAKSTVKNKIRESRNKLNRA